MADAPVAAPQNRSKAWLIWGAFTIFLVAPLYLLAVLVLVRSGLLDSGALNDEQYKAMWTFIASGLAATATVLAALLTKSHNDRTTALLVESNAKKAVLDKEALARQRLETVVSSLGLLSDNGVYAPQAVLAGALSTLVELGHPPIASRALAAALDDNVVDNATAAWLLDSMLTSQSSTLREEAADVLRAHAGALTSSSKGFFDWPSSLVASWPKGLSANAGLNCIVALIELLLSRDQNWWGHGWSWIGYTLDEAMQQDPHKVTQGNAAKAFMALSPFLGNSVQGLNDWRTTGDVRALALGWLPEAGATLPLERIAAWGAVASQGHGGGGSMQKGPESDGR